MTAITYGTAIRACEAMQDADLAFVLYKEACDGGVVASVDVHNALIKVCTAAGRLDEALEEIKRLMRDHGDLQLATINALTCALADAPGCIGTLREVQLPAVYVGILLGYSQCFVKWSKNSVGHLDVYEGACPDNVSIWATINALTCERPAALVRYSRFNYRPCT